jgi:hypothetical protein
VGTHSLSYLENKNKNIKVYENEKDMGLELERAI